MSTVTKCKECGFEALTEPVRPGGTDTKISYNTWVKRCQALPDDGNPLHCLHWQAALDATHQDS